MVSSDQLIIYVSIALVAIVVTTSIIVSKNSEDGSSTSDQAGQGGQGGRGGREMGCLDTGACSPSDTNYFFGDTYQSMSALQKLSDLWSQCTEDDTVADQSWELDDLFHRRMAESFNREADEISLGRPKINHSQGVVAIVEWEDLGGHDYTGIYNGGSDKALIRMSESNFLIPEASGLAPSLAIKFLRDKMPSVNHLANVGFESTSSFNFFSSTFRSRIDLHTNECAAETIELKFLDIQNSPQSLGLAAFSRFNVDGTEINDFVFPFELHFVPNNEVANLWQDEREYDTQGQEIPFYEQLQQIPTSSNLFEVWARDVPDNIRRFPQGSNLQHIGNIKLKTQIITSYFGDTRLFFQHERMNQDNDAEPEWRREITSLDPDDAWNERPANGWPQDDEEAEAWVRGSIAEYGCPFAWLLDYEITPIYSQ